MSEKLYRLYCETCNWKKITDGTDIKDLYEYKTSSIQKSIPHIDYETKKVVSEFTPQNKKFRCPNCGRPVSPRKISNPQADVNQRLEEERRERIRKDVEKNWIDGH